MMYSTGMWCSISNVWIGSTFLTTHLGYEIPSPSILEKIGTAFRLRTETVVNDSEDLRCRRRLVHLDDLQSRARAVNTTLLNTERVGQGCVLASPAFGRIAQPPPSPRMAAWPRPYGSATPGSGRRARARRRGRLQDPDLILPSHRVYPNVPRLATSQDYPSAATN
jgi:hypothetical protein